MRVLFINERLDYASSSSYSMDLALALKERGDEVRICTRGGALIKSFRSRGLETYQVRFNLFSFRKLIHFLREFDPHLIHVQSASSVETARRIVPKLKKPTVMTIHRRPLVDPCHAIFGYLRGVVCINDIIRETMVNDWSVPRGLVRTIKRGIHFARPKLETCEWDRRDHIPVIGSVGRLIVDKGHHVFIDAAKILLDRGVEAHFTIAGDGPAEPELREQVRRLELEKDVTFSPSLARRIQLYAMFDIVALPVLSSGVGVTALEAMAMGKPLISTGVGELLHIVQDGKNGLLVPEGDANSLADRIEELVRDPNRGYEIARQARTWVEKNFALEPMVEATREFYEEVLAGVLEESQLRPS